MKLRLFNIANIYIALWCLYAFHWHKSQVAIIDALSNLFLFLAFGLSFWIIKGRFSNLPTYLNGSKKLMLFLGFYGLIEVLFYDSGKGHISSGTYITAVMRSFVPTFAFYYLTKSRKITEKSIQCWTLFIVALYCFFYYRFYHSKMDIINRDGFTNNLGYVILSIMPLCFCIKNKLVQFFISTILFLMVVFAMKRGAIIIGFFVYAYFIITTFRASSKKGRFIVFLFSVISLYACKRYLFDLYMSNEYFQVRLLQTMEGDVSGRDNIAKLIIDYLWTQANVFQIVFGSGSDGTLRLIGAYAHNDWLEILFNQGIVGIIMYVIYWISFFKQWMGANRFSKEYMVIGAVFLIYFFSSFFSMSYSVYSLPACLALGYAIAIDKNTHR